MTQPRRGPSEDDREPDEGKAEHELELVHAKLRAPGKSIEHERDHQQSGGDRGDPRDPAGPRPVRHPAPLEVLVAGQVRRTDGGLPRGERVGSQPSRRPQGPHGETDEAQPLDRHDPDRLLAEPADRPSELVEREPHDRAHEPEHRQPTPEPEEPG